MNINRRKKHPAQEGDDDKGAFNSRPRPPGHLRLRIPRTISRISSPWVNLATYLSSSDSDSFPGLPLTGHKASDLALMLRARRIPHRLGRDETGAPAVFVPQQAVRTAVREVRLYIDENRDTGTLIPDWTQAPPVTASIIFPLMVLLMFFVFVNNPTPSLGFYPELWLNRGAAVADVILGGEWYRAATALTLHVDPAHALGNAVVGAVFAVCVCRELGTGIGWLTIILSGIFGNIFNAFYHADGHTAVGFSTAVFGAAGVIAGYRIGHGSILTFRFKMAPIAAGLGLVAMLGAGSREHNIDYGSHLFGFAAGVLLGLLTGRLYRLYGLPRLAIDRVAYLLAWSLPVGAWIIAWR